LSLFLLSSTKIIVFVISLYSYYLFLLLVFTFLIIFIVVSDLIIVIGRFCSGCGHFGFYCRPRRFSYFVFARLLSIVVRASSAIYFYSWLFLLFDLYKADSVPTLKNPYKSIS